jgi:hypothetical protein
MELAPIIVFAFNRPEHTRQTLEALMQNHLADKSELFIYIDGPRTEEEVEKVNSVKKIAEEKQWCAKVSVVESKTNKGLAASVVKGVTDIVNKYGKVIVLEDDLVSDKWFLKFMNNALTVYENETDVVCATGYIYPVSKPLPETFFIKGADCWGWATWKRGWDILETNGDKLLKELEEKNLTSDFDFNNSYPYVQMLKDQIAKKNNSWAILWYASAYLKNKYCLYPGHSLIHNIGVDGSGTHSGTSSDFDVKLMNQDVKVDRIAIKEAKEAKEVVGSYFKQVRGVNELGFLKRLIKKIGG